MADEQDLDTPLKDLGLTQQTEQSAAPELLANTAASIPASPVLTRPNTQISPEGGTPAQHLLNLAAGVISGGIGRSNPEAARFIQSQVQNNMEQARKKRAGDQLNAVSTLLSQAYETGDPKVISKAHDMMGKMMEGAEPEVQQHFSDMALKVSQQIGGQAQRNEATKQLLSALPDEYKQGALGKFINAIGTSNLDPEISKALVGHLMDIALPKPVPPSLERMKMAIVQLPPDQQQAFIDKLPTETKKMLGMESKAEYAPPSTIMAAQGALSSVRAAIAAGKPVDDRIQSAFPGMTPKQIEASLDDSIKQETARQNTQRQTTINMQTNAQADRDRLIKSSDAPKWVDQYGRSLPAKDIIGRSVKDLPEGSVELSTTEQSQIKGALALPEIGKRLIQHAIPIMAKYKGLTLGDLIDVNGNKIAIKYKQAAGDPAVATLQSDLTDFLVAAPQAQGIPGSRESPRLMERLGPGMPMLTDTIDQAVAKTNEQILNIGSRWSGRGVDIRGPRTVTVNGKKFTKE